MEKHVQSTILLKAKTIRPIQKQENASASSRLNANGLLPSKSIPRIKSKEKALRETLSETVGITDNTETQATVKAKEEKEIIYTCPTSLIPYINSCPVTNCPANVSALGRKSGCAYNFLLGKQELSAYELSYIFKAPIKEIKSKIENGQRYMKVTMFLNSFIPKIKGIRTHKHFCPNCGIGKTTAGPCLNTINCNARKDASNFILSRHPLSIPELNIDPATLYLLLYKISDVEKLLVKNAVGLSISDIFGFITSEELDRLKQLKTYQEI